MLAQVYRLSNAVQLNAGIGPTVFPPLQIGNCEIPLAVPEPLPVVKSEVDPLPLFLRGDSLGWLQSSRDRAARACWIGASP